MLHTSSRCTLNTHAFRRVPSKVRPYFFYCAVSLNHLKLIWMFSINSKSIKFASLLIYLLIYLLISANTIEVNWDFSKMWSTVFGTNKVVSLFWATLWLRTMPSKFKVKSFCSRCFNPLVSKGLTVGDSNEKTKKQGNAKHDIHATPLPTDRQLIPCTGTIPDRYRPPLPTSKH